MYWSVFLLSTRINPFGRANIMALAGKRGVDSSSALRAGDQTRIDLTFGRQRAPSDRSAGSLPAVCDGGMQHFSPVVASPTSPMHVKHWQIPMRRFAERLKIQGPAPEPRSRWPSGVTR